MADTVKSIKHDPRQFFKEKQSTLANQDVKENSVILMSGLPHILSQFYLAI
jgi:hypothetical protein